jgi:hypothetical protein
VAKVQGVEDYVSVGVEDNVSFSENTMPKTGKEKTKRGRPQKTTMA